MLEPGETKTLVMEVMDDDLKYYDERLRAWRLESCQYVFSVGFSSRDLVLEQTWTAGVDGFEPV